MPLCVLLQERATIHEEGHCTNYGSHYAYGEAEGIIKLEAFGSHEDVGGADTGHEDGRQIGDNP
jgi:hypothetical protein